MSSNLNDRIRAHCEARGMKFKTWEVTPWDVDDGPSPWPPHTAGARTWPKAQRLREQIIAELRRGSDNGEEQVETA
jgi:hypothetical protein